MIFHLSADSSLAEVLSTIERDGACIIDDLIPQNLCDSLLADFNPHIDAASWMNLPKKAPPNAFFGYRTKRFHGLPAISTRVENIFADPLLLQIAGGFLRKGKDCRTVRVSTVELIVIGPEETAQELHRDSGSWPHLSKQQRDNALISANLALSDFTEENGATLVAPGSHLWDEQRQAESLEVFPATMKRGSALLYSGQVLHAGGANRSKESRPCVHLGYIPSWLAPLENHAVSNGLETILKLNKPARHLLNVVGEPNDYSWGFNTNP